MEIPGLTKRPSRYDKEAVAEALRLAAEYQASLPPEDVWLTDSVWLNPQAILAETASQADVVEGLVPAQGITWLYGPSMSFKTFVGMGLAVAVAKGVDWFGKRTTASTVVYVGAEGGRALHLRRAAAEFASGCRASALAVVQERPQIDTEEGAEFLRGVLAALTPAIELPPEEQESRAFTKGFEDYTTRGFYPGGDSVLCIIDTYSQTSGGDEKQNVAAYVKNLRDTIENAHRCGFNLSFIVIDHATKNGGSYIGSVAKLNDVDSQIELIRDSRTLLVTMFHRKSKNGREVDPMPFQMIPYTFPDMRDYYGKPVRMLVLSDGTRAAALAAVSNGKAGLLLKMIQDAGGAISDHDLREMFIQHPDNEGIALPSAKKAYSRAKDRLREIGVACEVGEDVLLDSVDVL